MSPNRKRDGTAAVFSAYVSKGEILKKEQVRIGLALSGGGMRAAIYHLGVMKYLAEQEMMGNVEHISTVSGASICMGLMYACNSNRWPNDKQFLERVLPAVKTCITQKDIQWHALFRLFLQPYYWDKKVNLLAKVMEQRWSVKGCLQDIAYSPMWTINTTAYESGKDFRFSSARMGERDSSYVMRPAFALSHAVAASAGFPVLIGPYKLKTDQYVWTDRTGTITVRPRDRVLHLWDGGVYDNMGLDPVFTTKRDGGLRTDINYLIVSNASGNIEHKTRKYSFSIENLKRLLDINMDQVESLRSQEVIDFFRRYHNGVYLKIGTQVKDIVKHCALPREEKDSWIACSMKEADVQRVADYKTTLERVSPSDFDAIAQHGYETARATMSCFGNIA